MSSTPREVGTLIAVILKARNLPNKRHIGKQDPYCAVAFNGDKRRTKAIKRGGQHPEWDEEIRFTLYEDTSIEQIAINADGTPPPPPPKKDDRGPIKIKGGKSMSLACYAEDLREPDLIGETKVDLTEVLSKGETDEWFTLMNKDKYSGEVYLELTFWSNEAPPVKKVNPKPKPKKQYGGPGSFVPSGESPNASATNSLDGSHTSSSRISSVSSVSDSPRESSIPASLRTSSSLAKVDLYVPPYESSRSHHQVPSVESITDEFSEFGVNTQPSNRRTSMPSSHSYLPRPSSSIGFSEPQSMHSRPSYGYDQGSYSDSSTSYAYDRSVTPSGSMPYQNGSGSREIVPYQAPYESALAPHPPVRRPRYSIPASSSGFMPIPSPTPAPSGFQSASSFHSLSSQVTGPGFLPSSASTPAPYGFGTPYGAQSSTPIGYGPPPRLPAPTTSFPQSSFPTSMIPSSSFPNVPESHSSQSNVVFPQYGGGSSGYPQQPPPAQPLQPMQQQSMSQQPFSQLPPSHPSHLSASSVSQSPSPAVQTSQQQSTLVPPPPPLGRQRSYSNVHDHHAIYVPNASSSATVTGPPQTHDSPSPVQPGSRPLPQPSAGGSTINRHVRRQSSLPMPPGNSPGGAFSPTGASALGYPAVPPSTQVPPPPPPSATFPAPAHASSLPTPPAPSQISGFPSLPGQAHSGNIPAPPGPTHSNSVSAPHVPGGQSHQLMHSSSLPAAPTTSQSNATYNTSLQPLPGPPPQLPYNNSRLPSSSFPQSSPQGGHQPQPNHFPALAPPPPPLQGSSRRPSLPPPPVNYQQQSAFQSLPPPPPLPPHAQQEVTITFPSAQVSYPGPLPRPPSQYISPSQSQAYRVSGNWQ